MLTDVRTAFNRVAVAYGFAQATTFNNEIDEFYTGVRILGMGGTYVNSVNDETALLTNPAGLGKLRDYTVTIADPEFHGAFTNTEIVDVSNFMDALSVQGLLDVLNEAKGKNWHAKGQLFPSFVAPNFGIQSLQNISSMHRSTPRERCFGWITSMIGHWPLVIILECGAEFLTWCHRTSVNRTEIHSD